MGNIDYDIEVDVDILRIKILTDADQLDIHTVIFLLINFNNIITDVNRALYGNTNTIEVKVSQFEEGSFIIIIEIYSKVKQAIVSVFGGDTGSICSNIVTVIGGLFALYKFLYSKINIDNQLSNAFLRKSIDEKVEHILKNNPVIETSIENVMRTLHEEKDVEGLELSDGYGRELANIDLFDLSKIRENLTHTTHEFIQNRRVLKIVTETNTITIEYKSERIPVVLNDQFALTEIDDILRSNNICYISGMFKSRFVRHFEKIDETCCQLVQTKHYSLYDRVIISDGRGTNG